MKANKAARDLRLDEVVFVPAGRPWHKEVFSPAEQRLAMTAIATRSHPGFSASRIEVDRAGPTYTVDTLRELRRTLGREAELFFIAGADVQARLHTWREADRLAEYAHFVFCSRPGYALRDTGLPADRVTLLQIPQREISSTLIRRRVRAGEPIRHLVPDPVADYIAENGLYRS